MLLRIKIVVLWYNNFSKEKHFKITSANFLDFLNVFSCDSKQVHFGATLDDIF